MAGPTSIKVEADTKRALDDLQAELTRELGRKVTLQELTRALADLGHRDTDRLVTVFIDRPRRLSPTQIEEWLSNTFQAPFASDATDLDRHIYGHPHGVGTRNVWDEARRPPKPRTARGRGPKRSKRR